MKIVLVHNWHRGGGGSETVVMEMTDLLRENNHEVFLEIRDSRILSRGLAGKIRAFLCGIYCPSGIKILTNLIEEKKPDLVHVHEIYPFFSPWSLAACRKMNIPVIMTCHDHRLTCPIAFHSNNGKVCELCAGGNEYWVVLKNCRNNLFESLAYFLRSYLARKFCLFHINVSHFIALNEFTKKRMINEGFDENKISVLPNIAPSPDVPTEPSKGEYVAYIGRLSYEKGIDTLLLAASRLSNIPFKIAGEGELLREFEDQSTENVHFEGFLKNGQLENLYRKSRFIVVPSKCFEMCPVVIMEAMNYGLPVITARTGPLSEMVEDGNNGLLFNPGDVQDLIKKIRWLWNDKELCNRMGQANREKSVRVHNKKNYYRQLMEIYNLEQRI